MASPCGCPWSLILHDGLPVTPPAPPACPCLCAGVSGPGEAPSFFPKHLLLMGGWVLLFLGSCGGGGRRLASLLGLRMAGPAPVAPRCSQASARVPPFPHVTKQALPKLDFISISRDWMNLGLAREKPQPQAAWLQWNLVRTQPGVRGWAGCRDGETAW